MGLPASGGVRAMFRSRLTVRLVFSHLLVIVVVLGVAGAALLTQSRRYFVDSDRRALLIQALAAAASCDPACVETGRAAPGLRNSALPSGAVISQNRNISESATTVDPSSQRLQTELSSTLTIVRSGARGQERTVVAALRGSPSANASASSVIAAAPIRQGSSVIGAAVVRGDLDDVNAVVRDLRRALFVVLALSAVLAALVGFIRARAIARPLRTLTSSAQAIADGDFSATIPASRGTDELAVLANTFASMRDRVTHELATRAAFVADASHELRTPLTAIKGSVEVLLDGGGDDPAVRARFLSNLEQETDRLLALVNGLLDLDSAERSTDHEPVDLGDLARSVIAQVHEYAPAAIDLRAADGVVTSGDRAQLRQVLLNLIDNACTHGGRSVTVRVRMNERCVVEVIDDGPGIAVEDRARVLERFVRLDSSRSRANASPGSRDRGSGLGLSIVQAIVSAHNGLLSIRGGDDGRGTAVAVDLPRHPLSSVAQNGPGPSASHP